MAVKLPEAPSFFLRKILVATLANAFVDLESQSPSPFPLLLRVNTRLALVLVGVPPPVLIPCVLVFAIANRETDSAQQARPNEG